MMCRTNVRSGASKILPCLHSFGGGSMIFDQLCDLFARFLLPGEPISIISFRENQYIGGLPKFLNNSNQIQRPCLANRRKSLGRSRHCVLSGSFVCPVRLIRLQVILVRCKWLWNPFSVIKLQGTARAFGRSATETHSIQGQFAKQMSRRLLRSFSFGSGRGPCYFVFSKTGVHLKTNTHKSDSGGREGNCRSHQRLPILKPFRHGDTSCEYADYYAYGQPSQDAQNHKKMNFVPRTSSGRRGLRELFSVPVIEPIVHRPPHAHQNLALLSLLWLREYFRSTAEHLCEEIKS